MSTLLERYEAGESRLIWAELTELGPAVFDPVWYPQALAVAEATMVRVAANLVMLIGRLNTMGYRFSCHYYRNQVLRDCRDPNQLRAQWDKDGEDLSWIEAGGVDEFTLRWAPRNGARPQDLQRAERVCGPIPVALAAMWRVVGDVNLGGSFRSWNPGAYLFTDDPLWPPFGIYTDPLDLEDEHALLVYCSPDTDTIDPWYLSEDEPFGISVGADGMMSAGFSGGNHGVVLPDPCADPILDTLNSPREGIRLVEHLRTAFEWGGFPGFEFADSVPNEIAILREGLLPI